MKPANRPGDWEAAKRYDRYREMRYLRRFPDSNTVIYGRMVMNHLYRLEDEKRLLNKLQAQHWRKQHGYL